MLAYVLSQNWNPRIVLKQSWIDRRNQEKLTQGSYGKTSIVSGSIVKRALIRKADKFSVLQLDNRPALN